MSCRLIVHADDYGISESVNNGICLAHRDGILTSTSIMASGAAFEHGVEMLQQHSSLDVGVHLTLIEEQPLLSKGRIPSLVGEDGLFFSHATTFVKKYLTGRIQLSQVRSELDRQICKVLDAGIEVSHLDSHQHLHALPGIRSTVVDLAREYGIPAVRLPSESVQRYMFRGSGSLSRLMQLFVLKAFCATGSWDGLDTPDFFAGFYFGGRVTSENLRTILENLPDTGICELMCHPGLADEKNRYAHWGYRQPEELEALLETEIAQLLSDKGVTLVSFRDVADQV